MKINIHISPKKLTWFQNKSDKRHETWSIIECGRMGRDYKVTKVYKLRVQMKQIRVIQFE